MRSLTSAVLFVFCVYTEGFHLRGGSDCISDEPSKNIIIDTTYGTIKGGFAKTETGGNNFYVFHSIPYAKPPIGALRFKYPEYPSNWTGIRDATIPPKICLQPFVNQDIISEDCLFINVFTPCLKPTTALPVIVWVHGGYFLVGDGRMIDGEPDLFIDKDVILVTINYRLGVFGYLSMADDVLPGNYGIKDQIMALEWVQDNIERFGGDPKRVTVMGQSAGAANVAFLLQTPSAKELFSAVIMDSGNSLNLWSRTRDPASIANKVASYFNIDFNTSDELRKSLQGLDAIQLLKGADQVDLFNTALSNPLDGLLFGPSVEPVLEGAVTGASHKELKEGKFNRVPVLTGFNSAEGCMFMSFFDTLKIFLEMYDLDPRRLAPIDLNINSSLLFRIGKMVQSTYFDNKAITSSKENFVKYVTDHEFARPAIEFVRLVSRYTPTYFYRFDYVGQLPAMNGSEREVKGVSHGEELAYIFYHSDEITPSKKDSVTRERLIRMWTNFAKFHNPTPDVDPVLQNVTWEKVKPTSINYLNIDENLRMLKSPIENYMKFWNNIYSKYGVPPFDTY